MTKGIKLVVSENYEYGTQYQNIIKPIHTFSDQHDYLKGTELIKNQAQKLESFRLSPQWNIMVVFSEKIQFDQKYSCLLLFLKAFFALLDNQVSNTSSKINFLSKSVTPQNRNLQIKILTKDIISLVMEK